MAEGIDDQQVEKICAEIKQVLYNQLQTNTQYLFKLKQLHIKGKYESLVPVEDTISKNSAMPKMVKDIINELGNTNMEISLLIGNLPVGLRDSVYSSSSGISSWPDNPGEDLTEAVQEEGNGDLIDGGLYIIESGPDNPVTNIMGLDLRNWEAMTCVNQVGEPNHPVEQVPMRPTSEYFLERQGTASQTPRRRRGTRQVVDDTDVDATDATEEEPSP